MNFFGQMKINILTALALVLLSGMLISGCAGNSRQEYAVLIGEDAEIVDNISNIDVLVIDAEYFTSDDINTMKSNGVNEVYSYINVGAIENFRSYYDEYVDITLGDYENWPEERWVDVSQEKWQEFMASRIDELGAKGIDGFFVDNTDVYYLYPEDGIYDGLVNILSYMKKCGKQVVINGGDCFVSRYIESMDAAEGKNAEDSINPEGKIIDAVNQENVYTCYDFSNGEYGINSEDDKAYYTEYLDKVLGVGCRAYALEYADDKHVAEDAEAYSREHGYICYVADNIELKMKK